MLPRVLAVSAFVAACLSVSAAHSQEPLVRLSLDEAVSLALTENPTVRAKQFERQSVSANEITAGLRPNPTATFSGEQFTPGGSSGAAITQYTISIGQPIELGGKRQRRVDSARAATRVTGYELADLQRQTVFQVKKSFTDILIARDTLALAEENLTTLDELERVQRFRAEKGDISQLDLLRIQVQRFQFERDAADARQGFRAAKIALRAVCSQERLGENFEAVGDLAYRDVPYDRAALYSLVMQNRPDVRAAEAARQKARADVNLARANAWWDITPQLEYQRIGPDNTIGFGISLPLKIFDRNQGEIARTKADVSRADAARQAVAVQALADVDAALSTLRAEADKVRMLAETYLPKARQTRDTVEYAYRRGGLNLLDYLDAQRTYRETALEYIRSLGNHRIAVYQLEAAVGGPLDK